MDVLVLLAGLAGLWMCVGWALWWRARAERRRAERARSLARAFYRVTQRMLRARAHLSVEACKVGEPGEHRDG